MAYSYTTVLEVLQAHKSRDSNNYQILATQAFEYCGNCITRTNFTILACNFFKKKKIVSIK